MILLDGDTLVHRVVASVTDWVRFGDVWLHTADSRSIADKMAELTGEIEHDVRRALGRKRKLPMYVYLSDPVDNWRTDVYPSYKGLRRKESAKRSPMYYEARQWFMDNMAHFWEPRLEADDLMGIASTSPEVKKGVIVSIDKDLLTIPGLIFNPDHVDRGVVTVTRDEADRNHLLQTLIGDRVDEYPGCPGIGPVKAERLLDPNRPDEWWDAVVAAYEKAGLSEIEALDMARVARILRHGEYDWKKQEVQLWTP